MLEIPGLLERFLRYVQIDTQSDETSETSPSTLKQLDLCKLLKRELEELGLERVTMKENGIVIGTIPARGVRGAPVIVWNAHVDTSPEYSGTNVKPLVHRNYNGQDILLPADEKQVIRVDENPELKELIGGTIITSDGSTLLGSDDKSGVAVIMAATEYLQRHQEISHGAVRVLFTVDEEIGRGTRGLDVAELNAVCGYTLDGSGRGVIDCETFSADQAIVTVEGVNIHPSIGKGRMVNAIRILSEFLSRLPRGRLSPETTDGREGFLHPYQIEGGVAKAKAKLILRDFETAQLKEYAELLEHIAEPLRRENPAARIDVAILRQYRNMGDGLKKEPRAIEKAIAAMRAAGIEPKLEIIRGGTDGALMTEMGLPTPNLSCGEHNPHSPREWTSLEEMQAAACVLVRLAEHWGKA